MDIETFLNRLPEEKKDIYSKVYEHADSAITNRDLAAKLNIKLSMLEEIRHDLIQERLIQKRRSPFRTSSGLSPSRKKQKTESKNSSSQGLSQDQKRHTFIIDKSNMENIRLLSHFDHKGINEFLNDLLTQYFDERKKDIETAISMRKNSSRLKIKIEPSSA